MSVFCTFTREKCSPSEVYMNCCVKLFLKFCPLLCRMSDMMFVILPLALSLMNSFWRQFWMPDDCCKTEQKDIDSDFFFFKSHMHYIWNKPNTDPFSLIYVHTYTITEQSFFLLWWRSLPISSLTDLTLSKSNGFTYVVIHIMYFNILLLI